MLTGVTPLSRGRPIYSADGLGGESSGALLDPEEVTFILSIMSFLRDGSGALCIKDFYLFHRQLQIYESCGCAELGKRNGKRSSIR